MDLQREYEQKGDRLEWLLKTYPDELTRNTPQVSEEIETLKREMKTLTQSLHPQGPPPSDKKGRLEWLLKTYPDELTRNTRVSEEIETLKRQTGAYKLPPKHMRTGFLHLRDRIRNYKKKYPELSKTQLLDAFADDISGYIGANNIREGDKIRDKLLYGIYGGGHKKTKKRKGKSKKRKRSSRKSQTKRRR
jgi:hypothetical protein